MNPLSKFGMRNAECGMRRWRGAVHVRTRSAHRGFALVIVLGIIVLLVVLAVGFISSAGSERATATGFRAAVSTRQLADTAVGLVQGQINIATTQGSSVAWASQPGMVRTFNNSNGALVQAYKLYSAPNMISGAVDLAADVPPPTWAADTAIWTDLNSPVEVNGVKNFPILDPSSLGTAQVPEGFSINSAPGSSAYQAAPMPVRWLYVLKDGSVVAPSNTTGTTATIPGATDAKGANPIVGRVAFWADDDTCKVNINTASEGTYWDTPRAISVASSAANTTSPGDQYEIGLADFAPAQKEYQRYAGHPATTSLSAVFPALSKDQIYGIVPRVTGGGSNAGTATAAVAVTPDTDRLYSSVDELMFQPNRTDNSAGLTKTQLEQGKFFLTARSRAPETNLFNLPRVAMWPIFRLGANGAPDNTRTTAFDRLIAFCASTGTIDTSTYIPYIFQREIARSATNDVGLARNVSLLNYLTYLTGQPVPGFGGNFLAKYAADRDQILTETFDYIRSVNLQDSTLTVPSNTYTTYFDPVAAGPQGINLSTPTGYGWVLPSQRGGTMGFGRANTLSKMSLVFICNAAPDDPATTGLDESYGSNVPTVGAPVRNLVLGGNSSSNGTALVPGEKYIQAMILPEFFSVMQGLIAMGPDMQMTISGLQNLQINGQSIFPTIPETAYFGANAGVYEYAPFGGCASYRTFGFGKGSPARGNLPGDGGALYPFIGTPIKIAASTTGGTMVFTGGTVMVKLYPNGSGAPGPQLQTFEITFPSSTFPVPEIASGGVTGKFFGSPFGDSAKNWWGFSRIGSIDPPPTGGARGGRLSWLDLPVFTAEFGPPGIYGTGAFVRPEFDTVRSMVLPHGDYRLIAASPTVAASAFVKHPWYDDVTKRMAVSLSGPNASYRAENLPGIDVGGKYISTVTYDVDSVPDIPIGVTVTPEATGDFDTGIALFVDGAYVNKPDEGDFVKTATDDYLSFPYYRLSQFIGAYKPSGTTFFSPNRQIPSSGMLGSLSTGVKASPQKPWQTLLFRPQTNHPSFSTTIPDHLLMDLFWMPVVEPYAISDRFSTAGKINMNYQLMPFTYIERSTGLRAALKAERLAAIPVSKGSSYKGTGHRNDPSTVTSYRLPIDRDVTLSQFQTKFASGQIFKSASEIADIHIVPTGQTVANMANASGFWQTNALTGDNLRERIYTTLYPRLTTKSNTFTVHFRVQALKQVPSTSAGTFTEGKDVVLGEYRGSTTIERFIDANNPNIPDYAATPASIPSLEPLDKFYRWRIVENRQFAP